MAGGGGTLTNLMILAFGFVLVTLVMLILATLPKEQNHLSEKMMHRHITPIKNNGDLDPATPMSTSGTPHDADHEHVIRNQQQQQQQQSQQLVETTTATNENKNKNNGVKMYVDNHPILSLSDEEFTATSIDKMMSWYGEAEGGGSCQDDFGNKLIERWRKKKQVYCEEDRAKSIGAPSSSIDCYLVHQTRHHGNGDNLCHMHDVSVELGLFGDDKKVRPVVENYVNTQHYQQPYIHFENGFVEGTCSPVPELWSGRVMPGWNEDWTTKAYKQVFSNNNGNNLRKEDGAGSALRCDEWIEHPVLIVQRDTFANFFHDSEDFFNVFIAFAILQWKFDNAQIFLTDLYPKGAFWDIWAKPFSGKYPVLDAWDLRQRFGKSDPHYRVCFRDLAIGIYGPAAPITVASWDTPCHTTALVRAYSDHIIRGMKLQHLTHYAQPQPPNVITITYLARRSSTEWPEKKFCDNDHSFFLCELWKDWGIRSLARTISNDKQMVEELKLLETETFSNGAVVKFRDVDFNLLTFEEQIKVDITTDILIGPHGAGLMHNIFMPDRGALLELSLDGSGANRHFHNLAHWYGRRYDGIFGSSPVDVNSLKKHIRDAIESISLSNY